MKRMRFNRDMFYNSTDTVATYEKDKIYEIEDRNVDRWLKRGGEIVEDLPKVEEPEIKEPVEPVKEKLEDSQKTKQQEKPKVKGKK